MILTGDRALDIIIVLCIFWIRSANSESLTNLQIINSLIGSGINEAFRTTLLDSVDQLIIIEPEPRTGNEWLIEQRLAEQVASKPEIRLIYLDRNSHTHTRKTLVFEFKIIDIQVSYQPESAGRLTRSIQIVWFMKLQTGAGVVLFLNTCTKSREDQINRNDVAKVENANLTITRGQLPETGIFAKYIEPIAISIVSGLIVYLFFIMRSN